MIAVSAMAEPKPFTFGEEFPTAERQGRPARARHERSNFRKEDVAAANADGYAAGHAAGLEEARQEIARLEAQALECFARELTAFKAAHENALPAFGREALELALAIGRAIAPKLMERAPLVEIEGLVGACMSQIMGEARIVIRVHPSLIDALGARIDTTTKKLGFDGAVILLEDDAIAPGDCRVEWPDGGATRDAAAVTADIEATLGRMLDAADGPQATGAPDDAPPQQTPAPVGEDHVG